MQLHSAYVHVNLHAGPSMHGPFITLVWSIIFLVNYSRQTNFMYCLLKLVHHHMIAVILCLLNRSVFV